MEWNVFLILSRVSRTWTVQVGRIFLFLIRFSSFDYFTVRRLGHPWNPEKPQSCISHPCRRQKIITWLRSNTFRGWANSISRCIRKWSKVHAGANPRIIKSICKDYLEPPPSDNFIINHLYIPWSRGQFWQNWRVRVKVGGDGLMLKIESSRSNSYSHDRPFSPF